MAHENNKATKETGDSDSSGIGASDSSETRANVEEDRVDLRVEVPFAHDPEEREHHVNDIPKIVVQGVMVEEAAVIEGVVVGSMVVEGVYEKVGGGGGGVGATERGGDEMDMWVEGELARVKEGQPQPQEQQQQPQHQEQTQHQQQEKPQLPLFLNKLPTQQQQQTNNIKHRQRRQQQHTTTGHLHKFA